MVSEDNKLRAKISRFNGTLNDDFRICSLRIKAAFERREMGVPLDDDNVERSVGCEARANFIPALGVSLLRVL